MSLPGWRVLARQDPAMVSPEKVEGMTRLERLAQSTGVELAAEEIERLLARFPEAPAWMALELVRGRLEVLSFAL